MAGLLRQFSTPAASIEGAAWVLDDPELPEDKRRELVGIVRKEAHRPNRVLRASQLNRASGGSRADKAGPVKSRNE